MSKTVYNKAIIAIAKSGRLVWHVATQEQPDVGYFWAHQ